MRLPETVRSPATERFPETARLFLIVREFGISFVPGVSNTPLAYLREPSELNPTTTLPGGIVVAGDPKIDQRSDLSVLHWRFP